jgi:hypothetical protein
MAVRQKEESPVCFRIEPLSTASDLSASLLTKHDFPRGSTVLGRTTLCNEVPENAESSMRSNVRPSLKSDSREDFARLKAFLAESFDRPGIMSDDKPLTENNIRLVFPNAKQSQM